MLTKNELLSGLGKFKRGLENELTMPAYTAGYGLSLADNEFTVTLESGGLSLPAEVEDFFAPHIEFQERYAQAPFDAANVVGLDLSHFVDGVNFELDTENLTDGQVTRIRSGSASYNVDNGISRGYVEVKTICACTLTVIYQISSQSSYDYGGCIITEDAPNTEFTWADLKSSTVNKFFYVTGKYMTNQTKTYRLEAGKTYYLNFGYAKNASTNTGDDRFYIHEMTVTPEIQADSKVDYAYNFALGVDSINQVRYGKTTIAAGGQISMASTASLSGSFKVTGSPTFSGSPSLSSTSSVRGDFKVTGNPKFTGNPTLSGDVTFSGNVDFQNGVPFVLGSVSSTVDGMMWIVT